MLSCNDQYNGYASNKTTILKSLHGDTKETRHDVYDTGEPEYKVVLTTCELEFFYGDDIVVSMNEGLDDQLKHIKDELDYVSDTTNNG